MEKIKEKFLEKKDILIFIVILFIAIFSRGYKLSSLPVGIHVDEAGMAYDAFCLATNGTDRWLKSFPVYLENFGGGQSVLYAYLDAIFIKIFGLNMITIRIPAFLLSIASIIIVYFTVKKEWGVKSAELTAFLITIMPWHIMASRWGLDCNLLAPMIIISTCMLILAKNKKGYILAGIFFGLTLYTYALSYLIVPVFLALILIYMLYTKKIKFLNVIVLGIPIFILAVPLILMILVNNGYINEINGFITIQKLPEYRASEIGIQNIKNNLGFIKTMFTSDGLSYNALPEFGTVYKFLIIFIVLGGVLELINFIKNIKNKKFDINSVMLLLVGTVFCCAMLTVNPNINKVNAIYIPMMFLIVSIMRLIYRKYKLIFYCFMIVLTICFIRFEKFYFCDYEEVYGTQQYFESDYLEVIKYVNENYKDREIHIFTSTAEPYIYTLLVNKISPQEFNNLLHQETLNDDLYSYGNYYFRNLELDGDEICIVNIEDDYQTYLLLQNVGFIEDENVSDKSYRVLYKNLD